MGSRMVGVFFAYYTYSFLLFFLLFFLFFFFFFSSPLFSPLFSLRFLQSPIEQYNTEPLASTRAVLDFRVTSGWKGQGEGLPRGLVGGKKRVRVFETFALVLCTRTTHTRASPTGEGGARLSPRGILLGNGGWSRSLS